MRIRAIVWALVSVTALLPMDASADIPIPAGFGFIAPFWMSAMTMGVVFVAIVAIEAAVARLIAALSWRRAIRLALFANMASSIYGVLVSSLFLVQVAFVILLILIVVPRGFSKYWEQTFWMVVAGVAITLVSLIALQAALPLPFAVFGSLIPAFVVTVLLEAPFWLRVAPRSAALRGVLLANVATCLFLAGILFATRMTANETPLVTSDWHAMQAEAKAVQDDISGALEQLKQAREAAQGNRVTWWFRRNRPSEASGDSYWPLGERRVAPVLISRGKFDEAGRVLNDALSLPNLDPTSRNSLLELLAKCEPTIRSLVLERQTGEVTVTSSSLKP